MKVKRLLSAFVILAMLLTMFAAFGTVAYAQQTITPTMSVEIVADTEGTIDVPEGKYGYYVTVKLSNYGTLSTSEEDASGRTLANYQLDMKFAKGVIESNDDISFRSDAETDMPAKPARWTLKTENEGYDEWTLVYAETSGTYPELETGETSTDEILLVKVPFITTKDYFNVDLTALAEIKTYDEDGVATDDGVETYTNYELAGYMDLNTPTSITVGTAPQPKVMVGAMMDFETIKDDIAAIYKEPDYKIITEVVSSKDETTGETTVTYTYGGSFTFGNDAITTNAAIGTADSDASTFTKAGNYYEGFQGNTGFKNATLKATANNITGKHWVTGNSMGNPTINGDKVLYLHGHVQQGWQDNIVLTTAPVTENKIEYGFSFAVKTWREHKEDFNEEEKPGAGGFGEIRDSSIRGEASLNYYTDDKIVRARLDQKYGYAVYNETDQEWVTILAYDAENVDTAWHDIKYVLDPVAKTFEVYFDGKNKGTFPFSNADAITAVDGIEFNLTSNAYNGLYATSSYYIDDVYAYEAPVNVTFETEDGEVLGVKKIHAGESVTLPTIPGVELSTTQSLENITEDTTIICTAAATPIVYAEDFENITIAESGAISTASAKPFVEYKFPAQFTTNKTTEGVATTYPSVLPAGTYTMPICAGGNNENSGTTTFTTTNNALIMKDGYEASGKYQFKIAPVSKGIVKVSYDILTVEKRRGTDLIKDGGFMALYDSIDKKAATALTDISDWGSVPGISAKQTNWYAMDGETGVQLGVNPLGTWETIEYYADIDNQCYTVVCDGIAYGPFAFYNEVTQIDTIYVSKNQIRGQHIIDNLRVETLAIADKVDLIGADGETVVGTALKSPISDKKVPEAPAVDGKIFLGWFSDKACTQKAVFATLEGDKVYAKYNDIVMVEDFEDVVVDLETGKIINSPFDIALGNGTHSFTSADQIKVVEDMGPNGTGDSALYVENDCNGGSVLYSFPEVNEGKVKVSYDAKIVQWPKRDHALANESFGALVSGTKESRVTAVPVYIGGYSQLSTGNVTVNRFFTYANGSIAEANETYITDTSLTNTWVHIDYYADLEAKTFEIVVGDQVYGPYPFTGEVTSVDGIYFAANRDQWDGQYYIDNLVVDTQYSDPIVTFKDYDGTVIGTVTAAYGKATAPEYSIPAGKSFIGWSDGENIVTDFTNISKDIAYTALVKDAVAYQETFDTYRAEVLGDPEATVTGGLISAQGETYEADLTSGFKTSGMAWATANLSISNIDEDAKLFMNSTGTHNYDYVKFDFDSIGKNNIASVSFEFKETAVYNAFLAAGKTDPNYNNTNGMINLYGYDKDGTLQKIAILHYTNTGYAVDETTGEVTSNGMGLVVCNSDGQGGITEQEWTTIIPYTGELDGLWKDLEIKADVDAQTFTVLLNGENKGTFPFFKEVESVDTLEFNMCHAGHYGRNPSYYVDNVAVVENKSAEFDPFGDETVTPATYTVNFYNGDNSILSTQVVNEGEDAVEPAQTPTKAEDENYTYTFKEWDKSFLNVTANLDIYPIFTEIAKGESVTLNYGDVNGDGAVNGADASLILQKGVDLITGFVDQKGRDIPETVGDVNGDGAVNGADASLILQKGVDLITGFVDQKGNPLTTYTYEI